MTNANSPRIVTSRRKIVYRESRWRVHQFKIISGGGDVLCSVAVLRMDGSLLLWLGGAKEPVLNEIALGMPPSDIVSGRAGLATTLHGVEGTGTALARRLTGLLKRPVFICSGSEFDRFTLPLVERGLMTEIKNKPECF